MMSLCTNGSWSPNPLNTMCLYLKVHCHKHLHIYMYFPDCFCPSTFQGCIIYSSVSTGTGLTATMIVGVVCSLVFLIVGVLLGVLSVYLILRVRGRLSGPTSPSPPPLPPPATYEEVGVQERNHMTFS